MLNKTSTQTIKIEYDRDVIRVALARAKKKSLDQVVNEWIAKQMKI